MSSKVAQLIGTSLISSSNTNRSLMTPSPISTISSLNDDLVSGNGGGGGGGSGGGRINATNDSFESDNLNLNNNFLNGLSDDSNSLFNTSSLAFRHPKAHFLAHNYSIYNNNQQQNLVDNLNNNNKNNSNNHLNQESNLSMLNSAFGNSALELHQHQLHQQQLMQQQQSLAQQRCGICGKEPMNNGKTLVGCLHSFCQSCIIQSTLEGLSLIQSGINGLGSSIITCPICSQETLIPNGGIDSLMPHYSNPILLSFSANTAPNDFNLIPSFASSYLSSSSSVSSSSSSSSSTTTNSSPQISNSSQYSNNKNVNNPFGGLELGMLNNSQKQQFLKQQHFMSNMNDLSLNNDSSSNGSNGLMDQPSDQSLVFKRQQQHQQQQQKQQINQQQIQLQQQQQTRLIQIENDIQKTFSFYVQSLTERRDNLVKELHAIFQFVIKQNHSKLINTKKQRNFSQSNGSANKNDSNDSCDDLKAEDLLFNDSNTNSNDLQLLINNHLMSIEFVTNFNNIQSSIRNSFGYIRYNNNSNSTTTSSATNTSNEKEANCNNESQQTSNTNSNVNMNVNGSSVSSSSNSYRPKPIGSIASNYNQSASNEPNNEQFSNSNNSNGNNNNNNNQNSTADFLIEQFVSNINSGTNQIIGNSNNNTNGSNKQANSFTTSNLKSQNQNQLQSQKSANSNSSSTRATSWSSVVAASTNRPQNQPQQQQQQISISNKNTFEIVNQLEDVSRQTMNNCLSSNTNNSINENHVNYELSSSSLDENGNNILGSSLTSSNPLPAKSQIKRAKMIYSCKFGEFGVSEGQFTEPSGVSINSNNDIIVADTNSHRIQIFDNEGRFKFKFGECGKREGQLLYPNRVAVVKQTGDIVVTERSPTHQIQIYNQYGQFLRKFGANILQHPRGVCVDSKNRIIVVECKVMRVIIFDLMGNVLHKFNCSKYLEFPNGCCCSNDREEIFISDNRAHCIKVFNYEGQFLRQIGGEGITNYPIGVGINSNGEVLVADNHNNFNLTVFNQDGQMITALESKVKHAQCFDVGLMDDGSIVLASKDYRIYVYKYNSQANVSSSSNGEANSNSSLISSSSSSAAYSNGNGSQASNSNQSSLINSMNAFNNF